MPGRQSHGRPLLRANGGGGKSKNKPSKSRSNKKALNAFAAAQAEFGDQEKRTPRNRQLDADLNDGAPRGKHARDDDDDDDDGEDEAPPRKMRRGADDDDDVEYGSDSSGNSWRVGAVDEDDDSEIDSDEAFGESDNERFEDYRFRGSKKKRKEDDSDDEDDDEDIDDADGASLGSDAIDLADALDMVSSDDDAPPDGEHENDDSDEDDDDEDSGDESSDVESDMDGAPEGDINAWASQFAGKEAEEQDSAAVVKPKIGLKELGLLNIKDSDLKKSLKLMTKEDRATKKQKLAVPLARRAQAKLDRSAAYEKTNESMGRWLETVKAMRRADQSLVFPLAQHDTGLAKHDNSEIVPLNQKNAGNELENTILAIMEESGLNVAAEKEKPVVYDENGDAMSKKAIAQQKRHERELKSREEAKARRIKKIKSKAYHRVHRKQRERQEMKDHEEKVANGEIDSEEEREAQDRQRAMERMGARHRESKWAKQSNKNGRAAWDDDVRMGVTEMAKRDEELRRRIEGKSGNNGSDDESDDSDDSDESGVDERVKLLRKLKAVAEDEGSEPRSKLMSMAFMQKSEARRKQANDEMIADIRRDLASDGEDDSGSDDGPDDIGRRIFGQPADKKNAVKSIKKANGSSTSQIGKESSAIADSLISPATGLVVSSTHQHNSNGSGGAWSQDVKPRSRRRGDKRIAPDTGIDLDQTAVAPHTEPRPAQKKSSKKGNAVITEYSSDDEDQHLLVQMRDQEILDKAFGGEDVLAQFQEEKDDIMAEDDEKTIETTLPGWGSWVGEGVSNRSKKNVHRIVTKKDGVKPEDRRDAEKNNVIINEKRVKKNDKYLASQLPHQYESRTQYERSLRLPMGPEFLTKQSFQDATKPRVIIKQGVIAPISKPTH
ncbi:Utp14-domain-containing protein [Xylariaceae sp. FL1272]|nr:Utp14-domain-containing protein [Xylariaceae sp. FL1272]